MLDRLRFLRRGIGLMTNAEIAGAGGIVALMMLAGVLESAIVVLTVPLVYVIIDPSKLTSTRLGNVFEALLGGRPLAEMFPVLAVSVIVLLIVSSVVSTLSTYVGEVHGARCRNRLARQILHRITSAPYLWMARQNSAVLARQIYEDIRAWRKEFVYALMMMIQAGIMIMAPAAAAVAIAPAEGFVALIIVAVVSLLLVVAFRRRIRANAAATKIVSDAMMKTLLQILAAMREVKVSGRPAFFLDQFNEYHAAFNRYGVLARIWGGAPASLINLLGQIGFVVTAIVLWWSGSSGPEIIVQLALIGVVVTRVVPAFNRLATQTATLFKSIPFVEGLLKLLDDLDRTLRAVESSGSSSAACPADLAHAVTGSGVVPIPRCGCLECSRCVVVPGAGPLLRLRWTLGSRQEYRRQPAAWFDRTGTRRGTRRQSTAR